MAIEYHSDDLTSLIWFWGINTFGKRRNFSSYLDRDSTNICKNDSGQTPTEVPYDAKPEEAAGLCVSSVFRHSGYTNCGYLHRVGDLCFSLKRL